MTRSVHTLALVPVLAATVATLGCADQLAPARLPPAAGPAVVERVAEPLPPTVGSQPAPAADPLTPQDRVDRTPGNLEPEAELIFPTEQEEPAPNPGDPLAAVAIGAAGWDSITQIARYDADELVAVGWIEGSVNFGGACGTQAPGGGHTYASFVARITELGVCQFIDLFDSDDAWPTAVAADAAGNIYVAGLFTAEVLFGGGHDLVTSASANDVFLARYTAAGALDWTLAIGGASDTWLYGASVLEDGVGGGDIVLAGSFDGTATFDGSTSRTAAAGYDMYVARYSDSGALSFAAAFGDSGTDEAYALDTLGTNTIVMAGWSDSTALTLSGSLALDGSGRPQTKIVGLDGAGNATFGASYGGASYVYPYDLALAADGDIVLAGHMRKTATFVAGNTISVGNRDAAFLARLDSAGLGLWATAVSSTDGAVLGDALELGNAGEMYVAGRLGGGAADFGGGALTPVDASDSFLVAYTWNELTSSASHTWSKIRTGSGEASPSLLAALDGALVLAAEFTGDLDNGVGGAIGGPTNTAGDAAVLSFVK